MPILTSLLTMLPLLQGAPIEGRWRAVLDLAGGALPFELELARGSAGTLGVVLCNGPLCDTRGTVRIERDSLIMDLADYGATIVVARRGDSLSGVYRNVGNRGPRTIPLRASRGRWPRSTANDRLLGSWDAWFITDARRSPRVFQFRNGPEGFEAAYLANSGDYGLFWGGAREDSFRVARFDGTYVFLLEGRLTGDTLRGTFHAGLRTQTPFVAVRSTGAAHLVEPTRLTSADTVNRFQFGFPDLEGRMVTERDPRLLGKVVLLDIFGTWCTSCHEAIPALRELYRRYHPQGLEIVGLGYEVSADSAASNPLIRRFRDKFEIPWPLLLAGINLAEETAATLPQLRGFSAYPTTIFLGRDGRIRQVYAGFRGPAAGALHTRQMEDFRRIIERLLAER